MQITEEIVGEKQVRKGLLERIQTKGTLSTEIRGNWTEMLQERAKWFLWTFRSVLADCMLLLLD